MVSCWLKMVNEPNLFRARNAGWMELWGKVEIVWTGSWTRSLEPDGDTQPLLCRRRGWLEISTRKQHDCIFFPRIRALEMLWRTEYSQTKPGPGPAASKKGLRRCRFCSPAQCGFHSCPIECKFKSLSFNLHPFFPH